jgi:hypothetical protein
MVTTRPDFGCYRLIKDEDDPFIVFQNRDTTIVAIGSGSSRTIANLQMRAKAKPRRDLFSRVQREQSPAMQVRLQPFSHRFP